jgi:hypothetical protein
MNESMLLHPDQVDELRRLLGTVEDWLLHTSFDVLDDLGGFLAGLSWGTASPEQLVTWLINDLGEHTLTLRPATATTTDGTGAA